MRLTRKKAIELCIELWTWLAETGKKKKAWPEWRKYKDCKGLNDAQLCWFCLYNNRKQRLQQSSSSCSHSCPYYKVYGFCAKYSNPFNGWYDAKTLNVRKKYAKLFLSQIKFIAKE